MEFQNMLDDLRLQSDLVTETQTPQIICNNLLEEITFLIAQLNKSKIQSVIESHMSRFLSGATMRQAIKMSTFSKQHKQMFIESFRKGFAPIYREAGGWTHSLSKPRGYPGDYVILEQLYDYSTHPNTTSAMGNMLDVWAFDSSLPQAVIARKNALSHLIHEQVQNWKGSQPMRLLSLASGAARELRELPLDIMHELNITLVDTDAQSLEFAKSQIQAHLPYKDITTIQANALQGPAALFPGEPGTFDLIYSFGLFDYLPDSKLLGCVNHFSPLLNENGAFMFCLKDHRYYNAWLYEWLFDWSFYPRTREDGLQIIDLLKLECSESFTVGNDAVDIYICNKKKSKNR